MTRYPWRAPRWLRRNLRIDAGRKLPPHGSVVVEEEPMGSVPCISEAPSSTHVLNGSARYAEERRMARVTGVHSHGGVRLGDFGCRAPMPKAALCRSVERSCENCQSGSCWAR